MRTSLILTVATVGLSACSPITGMMGTPPADPLADNAKAVVQSTLTGTELTGGIVITAPIARGLSECVAEHATFAELNVIAANGDPTVTNTTISTVLARPETVNCATTALT